MKRVMTLIIAAAALIPMWAADEIDLEKRNENTGIIVRPRSATPEVTASIDGSTITLDLTVITGVEYRVTDVSNGIEICCGRFPAGATTEFDLPVNIPSGTYRLEVYAYGCWWTGTFLY